GMARGVRGARGVGDGEAPVALCGRHRRRPTSPPTSIASESPAPNAVGAAAPRKRATGADRADQPTRLIDCARLFGGGGLPRADRPRGGALAEGACISRANRGAEESSRPDKRLDRASVQPRPEALAPVSSRRGAQKQPRPSVVLVKRVCGIRKSGN